MRREPLLGKGVGRFVILALSAYLTFQAANFAQRSFFAAPDPNDPTCTHQFWLTAGLCKPSDR